MIDPSSPLSSHFHVAGILVQAWPVHTARVRECIARIEGAVVHGGDDAGRLVVTLESDSAALLADRLTALQTLQGVLSAVLVSEHSEPMAAAQEVIPDDVSPEKPA